MPLIGTLFQAGIGVDQLILCFEPEAASLYCQSLKLDPPMDRLDAKYILVDMGGNQTDFNE